MIRNATILRIPRVLFGDTTSTRAAWAEIATAAWKDGTWRPSFSRLELVESDVNQQPIVVWNDDRYWESTNKPLPWISSDSVWQLNWIFEQHPTSLQELIASPEHHCKLFLEGIEEPWFAGGVLQGDRRHLPFLYNYLHLPAPSSRQEQEEVLIPILNCFMSALPTFLELDDRIATASGRKGHGIEIVGVGARCGLIGDLLWACGALNEADLFGLLVKPGTNERRASAEIISILQSAYQRIQK